MLGWVVVGFEVRVNGVYTGDCFSITRLLFMGLDFPSVMRGRLPVCCFRPFPSHGCIDPLPVFLNGILVLLRILFWVSVVFWSFSAYASTVVFLVIHHFPHGFRLSPIVFFGCAIGAISKVLWSLFRVPPSFSFWGTILG